MLSTLAPSDACLSLICQPISLSIYRSIYLSSARIGHKELGIERRRRSNRGTEGMTAVQRWDPEFFLVGGKSASFHSGIEGSGTPGPHGVAAICNCIFWLVSRPPKFPPTHWGSETPIWHNTSLDPTSHHLPK